MKDLIEALNIFLKYGDVKYPFHCEHDILHVHGYEPEIFSEEDKDRLEELGFSIGSGGDIYSFKYGSC